MKAMQDSLTLGPVSDLQYAIGPYVFANCTIKLMADFTRKSTKDRSLSKACNIS